MTNTERLNAYVASLLVWNVKRKSPIGSIFVTSGKDM